jgi:hypothetical protein
MISWTIEIWRETGLFGNVWEISTLRILGIPIFRKRLMRNSK